MNVGIVGLGLIGGSMAKSIKARTADTVWGVDLNHETMTLARMCGAIDAPLTEENIPQCDILLIAIRPAAAIEWVKRHAPLIAKSAIVVDLCGVKRVVVAGIAPVAEQYGFTFVGGHPMAGSQFSGFKYSRADLFSGAPMVLVPPVFDDIALLQRVKDALKPCHFGFFSVTTAEEHDKMIAFTSQMPHILSNAFIKSPTALRHKGFSAGSYKDLTRVAWLNPQMWAELFLENRDNVLFELDYYIDSLKQYQHAIRDKDMEKLVRLLDEGKKRKEEVDG